MINKSYYDCKKKSAGSGIFSATLVKTVSNNLFILFIVPVFSALFLYNRQSFFRFVRILAGQQYRDKLDIMLKQTVHTYFSCIEGMVLVYLIVGALDTIGFFGLEVRQAILFGFLTAIMTRIPYIGIVVRALLPISVSWDY